MRAAFSIHSADDRETAEQGIAAGFAALGLPAVNYGPGDPEVAHTADEHVPLGQIADCEQKLLAWLSA